MKRFAGRLSELPYDKAAEARTVETRTNLGRLGLMIGAYDVMIARHARSRGLVVVTDNLREFERVDGLMSEDWLAEARQASRIEDI